MYIEEEDIWDDDDEIDWEDFEDETQVVKSLTLDKNIVSEKDKPFILALIATATFILIFIFGAFGAYKGIEGLQTFADKMAMAVFGLMSTAWAWYFKTKE